MAFDIETIFTYILGLFLIYMCCWLFMKPLKWLFGLMISCLIGGICIWGLNFITAGIDLHIALNPITAMIAGVMGVPGVIMTYILQIFL
ncbi:MAG: pro-sigmaK processing inhibitor BofA family protein [Oscillospiraceae bacterium]